jgi:hypothetical protein
VSLAAFKNAIAGAAIRDVLLPGYLDEDESPVRFVGVQTTLFVDCEKTILQFKVIRTTGTMSIEAVDKAVPILDFEEDVRPAMTSLREQVLNDVDGGNVLRRVRLWGVDSAAGEVRCMAAQLELANGQQIFIDPSYYFGFRTGGAEQRRLWQESWPDAAQATEVVLIATDD